MKHLIGFALLAGLSGAASAQTQTNCTRDYLGNLSCTTRPTGMTIDWGILKPVDVMGSVQRGYQQGQEMVARAQQQQLVQEQIRAAQAATAAAEAQQRAAANAVSSPSSETPVWKVYNPVPFEKYDLTLPDFKTKHVGQQGETAEQQQASGQLEAQQVEIARSQPQQNVFAHLIPEKLGPGPHTLIISYGPKSTQLDYKTGPPCADAMGTVLRQQYQQNPNLGAGGSPVICVPR